MELTHEWNSLKAMYHRIDMGKLQKCFQWKVTAILVFQTRFITFKTYLRQEEGHHLLQKVYQKYENWYYCYNFYHTPNYWILTKFAQNIRHYFFSFINEYTFYGSFQWFALTMTSSVIAFSFNEQRPWVLFW